MLRPLDSLSLGVSALLVSAALAVAAAPPDLAAAPRRALPPEHTGSAGPTTPPDRATRSQHLASAARIAAAADPCPFAAAAVVLTPAASAA
ncbi:MULTISPECIES: hypothetical protein [Catenuloplanes]|uniref:Thiazole synthase ThiGH ThiG subunit n=1 Tax=Catenuloplanes niger TaxID=587534 RepID=A0AAE4A0L7_9ACTN|nr:hypothetical protein [Catenuloplanes niger]MDR7327030.1 thiazole synthase ThiGH ThiG subunit [Catenuloplanes niger]